MWLFFFVPETRDRTIHEGKIHSDDKLARITKVVNKKDTDVYRQKKMLFFVVFSSHTLDLLEYLWLG